MSPALNFRSTRFHTVVPTLQFLLQPTVPDVQMFHSSNSSFVTNCSGDISVCVHDNWLKTHPAELELALRVYSASFNNSLMLMISLSTAERMTLSSRPAVTV